jgi:hypothetical protein
MSTALKSFDEISLKVVAVRAAAKSDFGFQFPPSGSQTPPAALSAPLELPLQPRRDFLVEISSWHHGGLNE